MVFVIQVSYSHKKCEPINECTPQSIILWLTIHIYNILSTVFKALHTDFGNDNVLAATKKKNA